MGGRPQGQQPARLTSWRPVQRVHLFWGTKHFSRGLTKNPIVIPKKCFFGLTFSSGETSCLSVALGFGPFSCVSLSDFFLMAATAKLSFMPTSHAAVPQICCRFGEQRVCYASIWSVQQWSCGSQPWNCLILLITHVLQEALVKRSINLSLAMFFPQQRNHESLRNRASGTTLSF